MSKELDKLEEIKHKIIYNADGYASLRNEEVNFLITVAKSSLHRLDAIDNADPSEALTEIFNIIYNLDCGTTYEQDKKLDGCRKTIEKALFKAQENENKIDNLEYENKMLIKESVRDIKILENHHRVLEIIKEKNVDIWLLKSCLTLELYNFSITKTDNCKVFNLTEEEFNMLKEMFA